MIMNRIVIMQGTALMLSASINPVLSVIMQRIPEKARVGGNQEIWSSLCSTWQKEPWYYQNACASANNAHSYLYKNKQSAARCQSQFP
jgi:hypothetical protein